MTLEQFKKGIDLAERILIHRVKKSGICYALRNGVGYEARDMFLSYFQGPDNIGFNSNTSGYYFGTLTKANLKSRLFALRLFEQIAIDRKLYRHIRYNHANFTHAERYIFSDAL
jgi:hypothetical protein